MGALWRPLPCIEAPRNACRADTEKDPAVPTPSLSQFQIRHRIQIISMPDASHILIISRCPDHSRIIRTVDRGWMIERDPPLSPFRYKSSPQRSIGGNPACNGKLIESKFLYRMKRMLHQHINHRLLKRGRHIRLVDLLPFHLAGV